MNVVCLQRIRSVSYAACLLVAMLAATSQVRAQELFLTDSGSLPGRLWRSEGGAPEREIHRRADRANPAFSRAIMRLAQSAVTPEGAIYFASGLDGYIMHLVDGRHEIAVMEHTGQIRDVATTGEEHTVYFSSVATPQNGESLADGQILRRDFWEGSPSVVATVRQADVGNNWWGTFTIHRGTTVLATRHEPSRLFQLTSGGPVQVFPENQYSIRGLASGPDGLFYFTTGSGKVYRTADFTNVTPVLVAGCNLSDVALRGSPENTRP